MEDPDLLTAKIQLTFDKVPQELKSQMHIFFNILIVLMISTIIYIYFNLIFKSIEKYLEFKTWKIYKYNSEENTIEYQELNNII